MPRHDVEHLRAEAVEQHARAVACLAQLDQSRLDAKQRALRSTILGQLDDQVADLRDATRRALWLVEGLERTELTIQQRAVLSGAHAALQLAEAAIAAAEPRPRSS